MTIAVDWDAKHENNNNLIIIPLSGLNVLSCKEIPNPKHNSKQVNSPSSMCFVIYLYVPVLKDQFCKEDVIKYSFKLMTMKCVYNITCI